MNEYDVFAIYLALKAHFTSETYDYFKYNKKIKSANVAAYKKRNDKYAFQKIARKFADPESLIVANMVTEGPSIYVGKIANDQACTDQYLKRQKRLQSLQYETKEQLKSLDGDLNSWLKVEGGQHPYLLRRWMAETIDIDTLIVLDRAVNFLPYWHKKITDPVIWPHKYFVCKKYAPFCNVSDDAAKKLVRDICL